VPGLPLLLPVEGRGVGLTELGTDVIRNCIELCMLCCAATSAGDSAGVYKLYM
jgi:hypothetical protein